MKTLEDIFTTCKDRGLILQFEVTQRSDYWLDTLDHATATITHRWLDEDVYQFLIMLPIATYQLNIYTLADYLKTNYAHLDIRNLEVRGPTIYMFTKLKE